VIVEVLNEGLPRSAWLVIGDKSTRTMRSRLDLAYTMILAQSVLGILMTVILLATSKMLASGFVPVDVRRASITYVRLSSVQAVTSAIEAALSASTRALDNPDVPLIISSAKFLINIVLDFIVISKVHVGAWQPTIVMQAVIRLVCDIVSTLAGLVYFLTVVVRRCQKDTDSPLSLQSSVSALVILVKPSVYTFAESAFRNAIYLWLVHQIISLGSDYATAWGVFNTIRWGLIMVPVQALESSTLAFVGHNWGLFRAQRDTEYPRATKKDILGMIRPALLSISIALVFETIMCIALSIHGIESFAHYLSNSTVVAKITQTMWKVSAR
jgi:Na+-driven multidrug efflux pump